jgi:hypothetical protein
MVIVTEDGDRFSMGRKTVVDMVRRGAGVVWEYQGREMRGDISGKYWVWQLQVGDRVLLSRKWRTIVEVRNG